MYTAPDGTTFEKRSDYRRYLFRTYYSYSDRTGETLRKVPGEIDGQEFQIAGCTDCEIAICDVIDRAVIENCSGCRFFVGASKESILMRNCTGCTIYAAGQQLRLTDCSECSVYIWTKYELALEASHHIKVGAFNGGYSGLTHHFAAAGIDVTKPNKGIKTIHDFHKSDESVPRPRYTMTRDIDPWNIELDGASGPPENPTTAAGAPGVAPPQAPEGGVVNASQIVSEMAPSVSDPTSGAKMAALAAESAAVAVDTVSPTVLDSTPETTAEAAPAAPVLVEEPAAVFIPEEPAAVFVPEEPAAVFVPEEEENKLIEWAKRNRDFIREKGENASTLRSPRHRCASSANFPFATAQQNAQKRSSMKEKAEEELEEFYSARTNTMAARAETNRTVEADFKKDLEDSRASADENPWGAVLSFLDLKQDLEGTDLARMRGLLLKLKQSHKS